MKIFRNIIVVITLIFILWGIVSYIEITSQNLDFESETVLSNWNLFKMFLQCLPPFLENWHKSCLCLFSNYKTNICSRPAVLVKDLTESLHGHGRPRALVRKNFNLGVDFPLHIWYYNYRKRKRGK